MHRTQGSCDSKFSGVRTAFEDSFARRGELGASLCIYVDGRCVVDLWGGHANATRTRPWQRGTLACVASTGKGLASLCLLRLIERNRVELDAPVCRYWPEFAAAGKESITVRWLMSHRAGLPAIRKDMTTESMYQWDPFVRALAEEAPWWEPGSRHGYHALTFGFLLGEVVRRVSGKSIGRFFREEIGAPLSADFYFGVPESEDARAAEMLPEPLPTGADQSFFQDLLRDPHSVGARAFLNPPRPPQSMNTRAWRAAEIPASNGYATASGVARVYAALAVGGSLEGVQILERSTIAAATAEHAHGPDAVIPVISRFGLGFWLPTADTPYVHSPVAFGHPGRGGSVGFADPEARIGFGYVPNQYLGSPRQADPRARALIDAMYSCLD
ncbi:MAG TPA: serine hydrolase domain-containing protein [Steroidobacteraceae bacterium]|nr:serine hydrolase domain-containing protein [Steroidobacteraceae bacterium]